MFVIKSYVLRHFKQNATYILGAYLILAILVSIICFCLIFSNKDEMIPRALQASNETQLFYFVLIIKTHARVNTRVESCTRDYNAYVATFR